MTSHPQRPPACRRPSSQGWCSSLGPHWSSSWASPSPPPADTHMKMAPYKLNTTYNHTTLKQTIWIVHFCPSHYLVHTAQRGLLCAGDQMSSDTNHVDLILLNEWHRGHQGGGETLHHKQAPLSVSSPSHWALPCFALRCYWSQRWSANQRQRWRNCRGEA